MPPGPRSRTLGRAPTSLKALVGLGVAVTALLAFPSVAGAQEAADPVAALGQQVNLLWIVIGAVLVIFMQAGFALVETGFCRAKHAAHVVSTNFAIFGLGFVAFFLVGYGLHVRRVQLRAARLRLRLHRARRRRRHQVRQLGVPLEGRVRADRPVGAGRGGGRSATSSTWWRSWTPPPPSPPAPWPSGGSGRTSSSGASSAAASTTRSSVPGRGAAAGSTSSATTCSSASATWTSPDPASCTPWAAPPRWPVRSCSGPGSASSTPTSRPTRIPGHHIPMAMLGTLHPPVRLVRLQRRLDPCRHRRAVRGRRRQHGHRRRLRGGHRDALHHEEDAGSPTPG